jgi:VanZ family protein
VLKKYYLYAALFWTFGILYACLKNAKDIPSINILYFDKLIHVIFYLVFNLLWFLYLNRRLKNVAIWKLLSIAFGLSFFFGIAIELLQEYFTTTRSADIIDVLANVIGASISVFGILILNKCSTILNRI